MNVLVTKERRISNNKRVKAHERFHRALEAAAAGGPIDVGPVDDAEGRKLRVLVVDDDRANADIMSSLVAKWGHDFRRAYDGVTSLALAAAYQPDVLLLDMLMPELSGFEVATQVRRQDRLKHCFIIAVTGRTDAKHRNRCYEAGVDLFLMKPVAPSNMQTLLSLESERVKRLNGVVRMADICSELTAIY
jgi:chemosensory pili system protein ChpA (sensor histidine kinase/response regulator)